MKVKCNFCGKRPDLSVGKVNRARKMGLNIYCNRKCAGLGRRVNRTEKEKKRIKAEYDKEYKVINAVKLKKKRHEYFKRTYNPKQAAVARKKRMPYHIEYCRQPKYRKWKREYDQKFVAKKKFGEFWESALLIKDIEHEYQQAEVRQINNLHNKTQKRKRKWKQLQKLNYLLPL